MEVFSAQMYKFLVEKYIFTIFAYELFKVKMKKMQIIPEIYLGQNTSKIVNEYDQEIPQSQAADNPVAPRGRAAQPSRDNRKTN